MTEDGRDWGERCVDMYKIVDKVSTRIRKVLRGANWKTDSVEVASRQMIQNCWMIYANLLTPLLFVQVGEGTYGEVYKATPPPQLASSGKVLSDPVVSRQIF